MESIRKVISALVNGNGSFKCVYFLRFPNKLSKYNQTKQIKKSLNIKTNFFKYNQSIQSLPNSFRAITMKV